jgi:ketopantoate hydroxymethyltransferase
MKSFLIIVVLLATLTISAHAEDEACDMLFVQDAKAMIFDGSSLTLKEANPNIIFFCDRPV